MAGRARAALIIGLIILCSALVGAAVDRMLVRDDRPRRGGGGPGSGRERFSRESDHRRRNQMLDRMTRDIGLTPVQRAGIDSVMQRTDSALREIRSEMQPRTEKVFAAGRAEMEARLDSAQRVKFREAAQRRGRR